MGADEGRLARAPVHERPQDTVLPILGPRLGEATHNLRLGVLVGMVGLQGDQFLLRRRVERIDAPVVDERDRAVRAGITINGLPIVNGRPSPYGTPQLPNLDWYFEDCVIGGPGAFIVVADGFADFGRAIKRKLIREIANLHGPLDREALFRTVRMDRRPPCDAGEQLLKEMDDT